tara:strand:+ start:1000 stop:1236 length:237 start_codon:yes stop_codon:yes gene_type:complete
VTLKGNLSKTVELAALRFAGLCDQSQCDGEMILDTGESKLGNSIEFQLLLLTGKEKTVLFNRSDWITLHGCLGNPPTA